MIKDIPEIPTQSPGGDELPDPIVRRLSPVTSSVVSPPAGSPASEETVPLKSIPLTDPVEAVGPVGPAAEAISPDEDRSEAPLPEDAAGSLQAVQFGKSQVTIGPSAPEARAASHLPATIPVRNRRSPEAWYVTLLKAVGIFLLTFAIILGLLNGPALWNRTSFWIRHLGQEPPSPPLAFLPKLQDRAITLQEIKQQPDMYFDPTLQLEGYSLADLGDNQLLIPKIEVNAPIIWKNDADERTMVKALEDGIAHYGFTALPSDGEGNVFLTGHSSYLPWAPGKYKSIFANLDRLESGDQLAVSFRGVVYLYEVKDKRVVKPSDLSVLEASAEPTLTLMTCVPVGTNLNRLVVVANLISAKPTQPIPLPPPEHTLPAAIFYYLPS